MFEKISGVEDAFDCHFTFNGQEIKASQNDSFAAALLKSNIVELRKTIVSSEPRGPFCMMGACFECLINVDGHKVQACMTKVKPNANVTSVMHDIVSEGELL